MDFLKMLADFYEQREALKRAIAALEDVARDKDPSPPTASGKRRGRKSMGAEERQEVSRRMRRYWQARRDNSKKTAKSFQASSE